MPVAGRKPKPEDQRRNRQQPRHDWQEFPDVPNTTGPPLPSLRSPKSRRQKVPAPWRPLGTTGLDLWERLAVSAVDEAELARLLWMCEIQDQRAQLRVAVIRDGDPANRSALHQLDLHYSAALNGWCLVHSLPRLTIWPRETEQWWEGVRCLPHTIAWTDADWRYALDTAYVHARAFTGEDRLWIELRARERVIGTTVDARRDLRIRYVDPEPDVEDVENPSVTAMADYRRSLGE